MTAITSIISQGIGNRLFSIVHVISLSKKYNIECFFSDEYSFKLAHRTNYYFRDNIFKKLNFKYKYKFDNCYYNIHNSKILPGNSKDPHNSDDIYKLNNNEILIDKNNLISLYNDYKFDDKIYLLCHNYFSLNDQYYNIEYFNDLFIDKNILDNIYIKYKNSLKNSLCIQVRRGDYLIHMKYSIKDINYFNENIKEVEKYKRIDNILVMSDDMDWCKQNFKDNRITFIEEVDYIQLYLATLCENFIVIDSSFNFWSIMLNTIKNKTIICRDKWFFKNYETYNPYQLYNKLKFYDLDMNHGWILKK